MAAVATEAHGHNDSHDHHEESFVSKYIFSQDHKMIGKQFLKQKKGYIEKWMLIG